MARVQLIRDDLDGSDDAMEVRFALFGQRYQIDLSEANRDALRKALAPFIEKAQHIGETSSDRRKYPEDAVKEEEAKAAEGAQAQQAEPAKGAQTRIEIPEGPVAYAELEPEEKTICRAWGLRNAAKLGLKPPGANGVMATDLVTAWVRSGKPRS